jgi:hypothetical protein
MEKITTTIKREWLAEIVGKRKTVEYRDITPYWERRFKAVKPPFLLRLINGMSKTAPEVTVLVRKVVRNKKEGKFELHIGKILEVRNWDKKRERPRVT